MDVERGLEAPFSGWQFEQMNQLGFQNTGTSSDANANIQEAIYQHLIENADAPERTANLNILLPLQ